jgi:CheY-like chemotaxis protein
MDGYKPAAILLVEDDLGDQKLTKQSLSKSKIGNDVHIVNNAEAALEYLEYSRKDDTDSPVPDLILLDLNMPGMGGKKLLEKLKEDSYLDTIPVVILTTSDSDKDVLDSFQLQAAGYIRKPGTLEGFQKVMQDMSEYWFVICRLAEHEKQDVPGKVSVS